MVGLSRAEGRPGDRDGGRIISLEKYFTPRMVRNSPRRILETSLENNFFLSPLRVRIKLRHFPRQI